MNKRQAKKYRQTHILFLGKVIYVPYSKWRKAQRFGRYGEMALLRKIRYGE